MRHAALLGSLKNPQRCAVARRGVHRCRYLSATSSKSNAFFGSAGTILKT
jgi:hypothetical protein